MKGSVNLPSELIELLAQGEENQAVPTTQSKQTEERMDLDFRDDSDMLPSIRKELVKFLTNLSQIDNTGELAKALQDRGDKGADEEVSSAG